MFLSFRGYRSINLTGKEHFGSRGAPEVLFCAARNPSQFIAAWGLVRSFPGLPQVLVSWTTASAGCAFFVPIGSVYAR
jgi:hypothetical protein